jgi:hypothetical protein
MHLHREQNVALCLSQTVHDRLAGVSAMVMRDDEIGAVVAWYLYDMTERLWRLDDCAGFVFPSTLFATRMMTRHEACSIVQASCYIHRRRIGSDVHAILM